MMCTTEPYFCSHGAFRIGQRLISTLSIVHNKNMRTYKGCLRELNAPCVVFVAYPDRIRGGFRILDHKPPRKGRIPKIDTRIRAHVDDVVSIVCGAQKVTLVAIEADKAEEHYTKVLDTVQDMFCPLPVPVETEIEKGHDPLSYTFGIGGDIRDYSEPLPVQTSGGWDPDLL